MSKIRIASIPPPSHPRTVVGVFGTSLFAIAAMQVNVPIVQIIFFFVYLCMGLIGNVVSALMIELFPTALR